MLPNNLAGGQIKHPRENSWLKRPPKENPPALYAAFWSLPRESARRARSVSVFPYARSFGLGSRTSINCAPSFAAPVALCVHSATRALRASSGSGFELAAVSFVRLTMTHARTLVSGKVDFVGQQHTNPWICSTFASVTCHEAGPPMQRNTFIQASITTSPTHSPTHPLTLPARATFPGMAG